MSETCRTFADPTQFPDTSTLLKMREFLRDQKAVEDIIGV